MKYKNRMLIVFGPTGVGKTDFVDAVAHVMPSEIINGDMGQMYTPLSIGTAKPDLDRVAVPHHLFNIVNEPEDFTVVEYRALVKKESDMIGKRDKLPIVVGGSTFYLNALFFPPQAPGGQMKVMEERDLWEQLYEIDPKRAKEIDPGDMYRLKRALIIWFSTGKKPSEYQAPYSPLSPFYLVCLTRDRDDLYERINRRVQAMLDQGWVDEVLPLMGTPWEKFILRKKIIGYDDIIRYLHDQTDYETMVATIQQRTRNYAKRQMTYWRMLEKKLCHAVGKDDDAASIIAQVNLTNVDGEGYIKQLQKTLETL